MRARRGRSAGDRKASAVARPEGMISGSITGLAAVTRRKSRRVFWLMSRGSRLGEIGTRADRPSRLTLDGARGRLKEGAGDERYTRRTSTIPDARCSVLGRIGGMGYTGWTGVGDGAAPCAGSNFVREPEDWGAVA